MQMRLTPFILAALAFMSFSTLPNLATAQDAPAAEAPKPAETAAPSRRSEAR